MFEQLWTKINLWKDTGTSDAPGDKANTYTRISPSMIDNDVFFQGSFDQCADFVVKEFIVCGMRVKMMMIDNMVDKMTLTEGVMNPLVKAVNPPDVKTNEDTYNWLRDFVLSAADQHEVFTYEECMTQLMSGFVILLFENIDKGLSLGLQGFKFRSIEEPDSDTVLRGSREGFVEPLRINMSMIRRRVKNSNLKFEVFNLGDESKTDISLVYIKGVVAESVLDEVRHRLLTIDMKTILASGYIQTYFQDHPYSIFATAGVTERPDTMCGKINEGRVGIIVDGTPVAIFVPYLFVENFQNIDDYAVGPYYAFFTRFLKFLAFFISIYAPALYVAIGSFHQAVLPSELLTSLAKAEEATPFPLFFEALMMQIIYELIREAGLRLPKQFGFAITIVGALIVGEAAVTADLIGAPMVIVVAITATTSLVVPTLYETGTVLRFLFIFLAAMSGLYGMTMAMAFIILHVCSIKSYEVPYTSPLLPFDAFSQRDVLIRAPWKILSRKRKKVQDMAGSNVDKTWG